MQAAVYAKLAGDVHRWSLSLMHVQIDVLDCRQGA